MQHICNDIEFAAQLDDRDGHLLACTIEVRLDVVGVKGSHCFGVCDHLLFAGAGHSVKRKKRVLTDYFRLYL